jgi:hypothetical protein
VEPDSSVDTLNPESAEFPLANAAVAIGIFAGLVDSLFGDAEDVFTAAIIAFGGFDDLIVTGLCGGPGSYSCHVSLLLRVGKETLDDTGISITKDHGTTRLALHFLGTATEIVAKKRGITTDLAGSGELKTFFSPAFGFHLGHFILTSLKGLAVEADIRSGSPYEPDRGSDGVLYKNTERLASANSRPPELIIKTD